MTTWRISFPSFTVQHGNPARPRVDVEITTAEDGHLGLKFWINREWLAAAQALEGKYILATSAEHLSADDMLRVYKGQDKVEKANGRKRVASP